jgi:hypothetical protein
VQAPEEVDAILQLRGEFAPQLIGELAICCAEGANESIFEGLDSSFRSIYPVVVGLNQLECGLFITFTFGLNP